MGDDLLAPLDLAFWHLESPDHPMHLGALATFEPTAGTGPERAAELLVARASAIPRLRMRVRGVLLPPGGAMWSKQRSFDVSRHVHPVWLTGEQGPAELHGLVGELMERPLDRARPPWEIYVIAHPDGGPFSVLVKLHHALADGLRAVAIGAALLDQGMRQLPSSAATKAPAGPRLVIPDPRRLATSLRSRLDDAEQVVGIGTAVMRATLDSRRSAALATAPSATRRVATAVLDLDDLHRIRRTGGGTVNDVLLTLVAGMLRRWALERGEELSGGDPRALVPVSRRRPGTVVRAGNTLSGFLVRLPVGEADPLERLRAVRTVMDRNKAAGPGRGPGAVAMLADYVPPLGHRLGAPLAGFAARLLYDVLVTNVPLPGSELSLGGCPLTSLYPLAPLARGQSVSVAMSTYRRRVHFGLLGDGRAVPDLDRLAASAHDALAELADACAVRPV
ncbi:wax ester/triacylglycerol synthase family O-acyltransferase [Streptomyces sp. RB6PN25]|uniref:Diacylglycerol O-acyltransferase n=1 Tax=Streptomyces humicola TaxID=2953240 RepID=A0ABT1PQ72_9ACTN|nr:wax ester/triacylglycerol synthase family O-acyltransferase [Streptomyces humicola]MCQ4079829.1 wax ester/triacylglycerol synthase family O-acyltransferase [Streptomyces humicola]